MTEQEKIIADYLEVLALACGADVAAESTLTYSRGWYYLNLARKFTDGSIGTLGPSSPLRKRDLIERTEYLKTIVQDREEAR